MSLLIDIVDETGSVSEEMLKEVENLLQFAAELKAFRIRLKFLSRLFPMMTYIRLTKNTGERMLRQMSSHLLLKKREKARSKSWAPKCSGFR
nr:unknown [Bacillus subtilis]